MNKILIGFLLMLLFGACQRTQRCYQLEMLRLGLPEHIDTNDLFKKGASRYVYYDQCSDTLLIKSYDHMNPETGEPWYHVKAEYYGKPLTSNIRGELDSLIALISAMPAIDSVKAPDPQLISCAPMYTWIAVVTNPEGKRTYRALNSYRLYGTSYHDWLHVLDEITNTSQAAVITGSYINTDSLTAYYIRHYFQKEIDAFMPPPLRSTLRFTPPEIKEGD